MKKFLIGVIFLIPIVVVIALSATGAIISLTTPVNPEEIVIKNGDNVEIDKNSVIKIDSKNYDEFIIIDVLPAITQDKAITYERVEEVGDGEVILERIGESNRYSITPVKVGVTKLEIRAKANVNVFREITFYVTSDSIETINIYGEDGVFLEDNVDMYVGEKLFVDIYPVEALRNHDVQWTSSHTTVATVSPNGEVTIVGRGVTRIKATAVDKDGNTVSDYVDVDTSKAFVSSKKIYVTSDEHTSDDLKNNFALHEDVEVSSIQDNLYLFSLGEHSVEVEVVTASEGEVGFIDMPDVIYTRNGGYYPVVGDLITKEVYENIVFSVGDAEILEIESITGMIIPLKAGATTLTATYGDKSIQKEITVRDNPIAFELELGAAEQKLGIQLTRTWGQYFYDENGNIVDKFTFGLSDKSNIFDVVWELDDENMATITNVPNTQDVEIVFNDAVRGKSVTLTATLKINNLKQERVKRSFTFNVEEKNAINVYTWEEFKKVAETKKYNIVMQEDLYPTYTSGLCCNVYGNGFKIDGTNFPLKGSWRSYIIDGRWYGDGHFEWEQTGEGKILVEDVIFIGSPIYEESDEVLEAMTFNWMFCPVEIKYCQVSGFTDGLYFNNTNNVLVEGCIFGDNYNNGISLVYEPGRKEHCYITLRNNIFKQTGAAAVQLVTSWFHESTMDKEFPMTINIEGFMDVYNWKQRAEFKDIFATSILGLVGTDYISGSLRDTLVESVAKVIHSFINEPEYDHLFYKYQGKEYASFTFMGIGLIAKANPDVINTEKASSNIQKYLIPLEDEEGNAVGTLSSITALIKMIVNSSKPLHITNPCFLACADFENGEPEIKPGDPVPNSKELYEKLTSAINQN